MERYPIFALQKEVFLWEEVAAMWKGGDSC